MKFNHLVMAGAMTLALASCNNGGGQPADQQVAVQQPAVQQPVAQQPTQDPMAATPDSIQPQAAAPTAQSLPAPITQFVQKYFGGATVAYVQTDHDFGGLEYDVTLSDGTEIDFDPAHQWESVDCHVRAVPAALVPAGIARYVKSTYRSMPITKISRKPLGYEIELSDELELKFDKNGNFIHMDD